MKRNLRGYNYQIFSLPEFDLLKESYFTVENIRARAEEMQSESRFIRSWERRPLQIQNCALLVLDMQDYFCAADSHAYIPSVKAILPGVARLIKAFHVQDLPIIFTRHLNTDENAGRMASWWRAMLRPEDSLSQIVSELDTSAGLVIEKSQYDAFHETCLDETLRAKQVSQVVIAGVMTHICCETTARSAFMRGFEALFLIDGCATYNLAFHRASLLNLAHGFARLVCVNEVLAALKDGHAK
ncbi:MAG: cysteine hydrolase [Anaerolineales bacterium]|nr:cysteine hydrolase [Anaerolineales bacterium]